MNAKLKGYLVHYAEGTIAQGWNGGWIAVAAALGQSAAAVVAPAVHASVPLPTPASVVSTFLGAAFVSCVFFFKAHPVPVVDPDAPSTDKPNPTPSPS